MFKPTFPKLILAVGVILIVAGVGYAGLTIWRESTKPEVQGTESANDKSAQGPLPSDGQAAREEKYLSQRVEDSLRPSVEFSGEVLRGQVFEYDIQKEKDLVLRLIPVADGWNIWVGNKANPTIDFTLITPPLRGPNPRHLYGWQFAKSEDSTPSYPNYKQAEREFVFVLDEISYWQALDSIQKLMWPDFPSQQIGQSTAHQYEAPTIGKGLMSVSHVELSEDSPISITSMEFKFKLFLTDHE